MLKKCGKFFADWRDASGARHRKASDTLKEAKAHAEAMRQLAHAQANPEPGTLPNRSAQRPPLRKPLRSGSARKLKTRTRRQPSPNS